MCLLLFFCVYEKVAVMLASSRKSIGVTAKKPQRSRYNVPFYNSSL